MDHGPWTGSGQLRDEYRRDTLHMTPEGYAALNRALIQHLASVASSQ
jgi:lysophospholipase L1-like esterase